MKHSSFVPNGTKPKQNSTDLYKSNCEIVVVLFGFAWFYLVLFSFVDYDKPEINAQQFLWSLISA